MGNCMSTKAVADDEVNAAPHPQARRVWLVSTPIDSREIPLDLVGIDAGGLKAAMRNRGLETEHWALKVDPQANLRVEPSIFDITVQGGALVSQLHSTSSPYWNGITRRVAIGWTLWTDNEILDASKLLIQARPQYDGRSNNSQQLGRLLGRHIEFVPPPSQQQQPAQQSVTTASDTLGATTDGDSPAASILKAESAMTAVNNRSQMTLVSGAQSQRSQSIESTDAQQLKEAEDKVNVETHSKASRIPASIRNSHRMSLARPPLIHLSTAPTAAPSEAGSLVRPALQRSAETELSASSPTGSVRKSQPPQARYSLQQPQTLSSSSPLNPSHRTHRQTASEVRTNGRMRTSSDAAYATMGAAERRSSTLDGRVPHVSRRRSEAPTEWLAEATPAQQFSSVRSKSGGTANRTHRDSVMSLGGGSMIGSPSMGWGPQPAFTASQSMVGLPNMPSMGMLMPPMPSMPSAMGMPMFPQSNSMMFNPALAGVPALQVPYFAQSFYGMPMLAPPSPGFHSKASSGVPTPPESPRASALHLPKVGHEMAYGLSQPQQL